ncbi:MAG: hypothetical protein ABSH48_03185 [Verrucomicrobiota bacterium]
MIKQVLVRVNLAGLFRTVHLEWYRHSTGLDSTGVPVSRLTPLHIPFAPRACGGRHRRERSWKLPSGSIRGCQLRTVKELMEGKNIERPSNVAALDETFRRAPKAKAKGEGQAALGL